MAENKRLTVEYSTQALHDAIEITTYLRNKFSQTEIDDFYRLLTDFEKTVSLFPTLYPKSPKMKVRRAVLSKVLSVYYMSRKNKIAVVAILDNRWDESNRI
ncbi:MAG: hypothetical protein JJU35_13810 [Balneolales bacterium]|nr:hypothetical protein [Balneolales bacterium]